MATVSPRVSACPPASSACPSTSSAMTQRRNVAPRHRSLGRNVHIYDSNDPDTAIGGLVLTPSITNANFFSMIEIFVTFEGTFFLQDENETKIERNDHPLQPGKYYIVSDCPFHISNEPWLVRTITRATGTRVAAFAEAVRARDRRCVITGAIVFAFGGVDFYEGFDAAHIFPLAYERQWIDYNYGRWITIQPTKGGSINSVQNGIMLSSDIHQLFDSYNIAINPDDNHKVVVFRPNSRVAGGHQIDPAYFTRPDAPADPLLRWHFRQAVLANMRGAGEPVFEHDFPPGSDIVGDILEGPKAAERMQFELFSRLGAQMEIYPLEGES